MELMFSKIKDGINVSKIFKKKPRFLKEGPNIFKIIRGNKCF